MATKIDPKTLFSTPNHCVTSFYLWNIRSKSDPESHSEDMGQFLPSYHSASWIK